MPHLQGDTCECHRYCGSVVGADTCIPNITVHKRLPKSAPSVFHDYSIDTREILKGPLQPLLQSETRQVGGTVCG